MKSPALVASLALWPAFLTAQEAAKKPDAKAPPPDAAAEAADKKPADPTGALKEALTNMARLRGYHVDAELTTPAGKATISGDLGEGTISLTVAEVGGAKKQRIVAEGEFYLSADGGKTWQTGDEADKESTVMLSNIIIAPIQMQEQLLANAKFTAKEVESKGEKLLHLEKPAKGEEPAMSFWLCKEPEMKNMIFVRKVSMTVSATDMELPVTITYSGLTKPATIKPPVEKKEK